VKHSEGGVEYPVSSVSSVPRESAAALGFKHVLPPCTRLELRLVHPQIEGPVDGGFVRW